MRKAFTSTSVMMNSLILRSNQLEKQNNARAILEDETLVFLKRIVAKLHGENDKELILKETRNTEGCR